MNMLKYLLNIDTKVQVSDTRDDAISAKAGKIKIKELNAINSI